MLRNELKSKQHTISGLLKLVERLSQQADETSAQETAEVLTKCSSFLMKSQDF